MLNQSIKGQQRFGDVNSSATLRNLYLTLWEAVLNTCVLYQSQGQPSPNRSLPSQRQRTMQTAGGKKREQSLDPKGPHVMSGGLTSDIPESEKPYRSLTTELKAAMDPIGGENDPNRKKLKKELFMFRVFIREYTETGGFNNKDKFLYHMDEAAQTLQEVARNWDRKWEEGLAKDAWDWVREYHELSDPLVRSEPQYLIYPTGKQMIKNFEEYLNRLFDVLLNLLELGVMPGAPNYGDPEELTERLMEATLSQIPNAVKENADKIDGDELRKRIMEEVSAGKGGEAVDKGKAKVK